MKRKFITLKASVSNSKEAILIGVKVIYNRVEISVSISVHC